MPVSTSRPTAPHRSPAPTGALPALRPSRWAFRATDVLLPAALCLWAVSINAVNPDAMNDYGLLAALPVTFYVAASLLVLSIAITVTRPALSPVRLALHLVGLVLVLHATVPFVVTAPNYPWLYKHVGVVEYINRHGQLDTSIDIYHNWPGFFAFGAWFTKVAGASSPLNYAGWAPVYFNLLVCLELSYSARALDLSQRTRWLGLFLAVPANWVGQDYFAPQAMAFVLSLAVFGMVLTCMHSDRPVALVRAGLRLARRVVGARVPAAEGGEVTAAAPAARPPAVGRLSLLAMFGLVVVTHQLSPYMVLAGLGVASAAGLVRPRWVVVGLAAVAGGYLLLRLSYLQQTQDIFGSLFDPFENVKGNGVSAPPVQIGRRITAYGALVMLAAMWGLAMIGVVRRLRAGRPTVVLALLAAAPALLAAGQSYGGEVVFRIYLFSLPWTALLAASALEPAPGRRARFPGATVAVGGVLALIVVLFMSASFGAEELYRIRPGEVEASRYFYAHAQPDSVLILGAAHFPSRVAANYEIQQFTPDPNLNLFSTTERFRNRLLGADDLPALSSFAGEYAASAEGGVYLALTAGQETYAEVLGQTAKGSLASLDRALGTSAEWDTFYRNADAVLYRFLGPSEPAPAPPAVSPAPTSSSSDPVGLVFGVAGLAFLGLARRSRRARRPVYRSVEQEETMDLTAESVNGSHTGFPAEEGHEVRPPSTEDPSAAGRIAALKRRDSAQPGPDVLLRLLQDDLSAEVRAEAVRALARTSDAEQGSAMTLALADPSPLVRTNAVAELAGGPDALVAACDDDEPTVRRAAYRRLAADGVPVLWRTMSGSPARQARRQALGEPGPEVLAGRAVEGIHSAEPEDRVFAVELAAEGGTPANLALIETAVGDPDATVRRVAVAQLRGRVEATPTLVHALDDADAAVRLEAARTLDSVEHDDALLGLVARLDDPDPSVRQTCAEAVVSRTSAGLARRVAATLTESNRNAVEDVLLRMGPAGRQALAARVCQEALASAAEEAAGLMEAARRRAEDEIESIRAAVTAEAHAAVRAELEAQRVAVLTENHRRALEEAAKIRADAMADGERMRHAVLEDALSQASEDIRQAAGTEEGGEAR